MPDQPDRILRIRRAVGQRIRDLRAARGLSQERLAELAGVSRHSVYRAELGTHSISIDNAAEIAQALGVPVWWLFTDLWRVETGRFDNSGGDPGQDR